MHAFRAIHRHTFKSGLNVHVIGHRQAMQPVLSPGGIDEYFIYIFCEASIIETRHGEQRFDVPGIMIQKPRTRIMHRGVKKLHRTWMRFSHPQFERWLSQHQLICNEFYPISDSAEHETFLLQLHRELQHPLGAQANICEHIIHVWLSHIQREQGLQINAVPDAVSNARNYINQYFLTDISLKHIVAASGISRTHLCRAFKKYYHATPMHYALQLRLEHAQDLLLNPEHRLQDVAEQSGFNDEYYFNRCFKREIGLSPGTWRKQQR